MAEDKIKIDKLTKKDEYLGWSKQILVHSVFKKLIEINDGRITVKKEADFLYTVLMSVSPKIAGEVPDGTSLEVFEWIKSRYGYLNSHDLLEELRNLKMKGIDVEEFFAKIDSLLSKIRSCGEIITDSEVYHLILNKSNQMFYQHVITTQRTMNSRKEIDDKILNGCRDSFWEYFNNSPLEARKPFLKFNALEATTKPRPRFCQICADDPEKIANSKTHDTKYHRNDWITKSNYSLHLSKNFNSVEALDLDIGLESIPNIQRRADSLDTIGDYGYPNTSPDTLVVNGNNYKSKRTVSFKESNNAF